MHNSIILNQGHFFFEVGFKGEFFFEFFFAFFIIDFVSFDWLFMCCFRSFSYFALAWLALLACIFSTWRGLDDPFWGAKARKKGTIRSIGMIVFKKRPAIFFRTFRFEINAFMFRGRNSIVLFFICLTLVLSQATCKKSETQTETQSQIPVVPVSISLNPNSTEYIHLNPVNGWETITGGYKGIVVFRVSATEFTAFERACPYDWSVTTARLTVDAGGTTATCPSCKSRFILIDGTPFAGPSHFPLKQYQTTYDGYLLYIFN
jgi:nitrite reductase/ring-hydroxylating ferredoxin subunit